MENVTLTVLTSTGPFEITSKHTIKQVADKLGSLQQAIWAMQLLVEMRKH